MAPYKSLCVFAVRVPHLRGSPRSASRRLSCRDPSSCSISAIWRRAVSRITPVVVTFPSAMRIAFLRCCSKSPLDFLLQSWSAILMTTLSASAKRALSADANRNAIGRPFDPHLIAADVAESIARRVHRIANPVGDRECARPRELQDLQSLLGSRKSSEIGLVRRALCIRPCSHTPYRRATVLRRHLRRNARSAVLSIWPQDLDSGRLWACFGRSQSEGLVLAPR